MKQLHIKSRNIISLVIVLIFSISLVHSQITSYPYLEDFESGWGQWSINSVNGITSWQYGIPSGAVISSAASGSNAFVTNLSGNYLDNENGYLLSPVFDFSSLNSPVVQFSLWWNCEYNWDGAVIQYSTDLFTWNNVGSLGGGTNWFNYNAIFSVPGGSSEGWSGRTITGNGSNGWVTVSHPAPELAGLSNVYFRFVFASDGSIFDEGIGFDDFEIYNAYVDIPDSQFEQALIDQGIDTEGTLDGQVLLDDISSILFLSIDNYNITSFEGLQFFTSLLAFSHINNQAATINQIDFSNNLSLEDISIINAPNLAEINVSQNEFLQSLTVVTNNTLFNSIDLSNNFNLQTVILSSNGLTEINSLNSPILSYLSVGDNPISSLDVSSFNDLETLNTYDTQIEDLDLSNLIFLVTLNGYNGSLKTLNLQNGGGNTNNAENVDVSGNPNLECILVDSVAWAESPSGWIKDATASYFENPSINFTTFPGSQVVQSDGTGNLTEFNAWLASNGDAVVSTECGEIDWTYEILAADDFGNFIEYIVEFVASTPYTEPDITQATFTIENITEAGESDGTGGDLCSATSYDLNNIITVDLQAPNIDSYRFEQIDVFPQTPGVPDATFNGTIVDFPDTGAGSFSYTFKLIVEKSIDVYNTATGSYESRLFTDEAFLTVNNVKIPFNPGPNQEKRWCPGTALPTLSELYDEFEIIDDVIFESFDLTFTPENYWFDTIGNPITEVSGPGVYVFNANDFLPECGAIPATVTVVEGKSAGVSTSFEICPGISLTEEDLIASLGADEGGNWTPTLSDPNNVSAGTYTYSHGACTIGNNSTVTISLEQELFAGDDVLDAEDLSSYTCGDTVSFDLNTFRAPTADPGGKWYDSNNTLIADGIVDFPDTGAGSYTEFFTYRQSNDNCGFQPSEAQYEVSWSAAPLSTGTSTSIEICPGSFLTEQDLLLALGADSGGNWTPVIDINNVIGGIYSYSLGDCTFEEDTTITITESIIDINAQDLTVIFDPNGNDAEIDAWLANNGGAIATNCGDITWEWELVDSQLIGGGSNPDADFVCTIEFKVLDVNQNQIGTSTAELKFEQFPFAGDSIGVGENLCGISSYDLNQISSPDYNDTRFSTSNFIVSQTDGFPGVTSTDAVVDFPDTGAGQFSYRFDVTVTTPVNIGALTVNSQSTAQLTIIELIIPFDPGPNITVQVCDFNNIDLLDLYNQLDIQLDVDTSVYNDAEEFEYVFEPENFWYNENDDLEANPNTPPLTEITAPGVYQFNAKKYLQDCAGNPVFVTLIEGSYLLQAKVYLQGAALNPFVGEETLMRDDLRLQGLIPTVSPYVDGLTCDPSVFVTTGPDAIVDWIWIEFRDQTDNTIVLQGQSALLQRDGDIVAVDGLSPLAINAAAINAYLVVNHRNHLGVMTANPLTLNCSAPTLVDFTNEKTLTFGTDAQLLSTSGKMVLWAGDANGDGVMRYLGAGNDTNGIKDDVLAPENGNTTSSNFYPYLGYENSDIDMNGQIRYLGPGNDSNFLKDIILIFPANTGQSNFFPINEQIPD